MELIIAGGAMLALAAFALLPCTLCKDGWRSSSSGLGTCSWHGGID
jgi:hypothetical protein